MMEKNVFEYGYAPSSLNNDFDIDEIVALLERQREMSFPSYKPYFDKAIDALNELDKAMHSNG
jgi:hypothetical protein